MISFVDLSKALEEAAFKLPSGHKQLKTTKQRVAGKIHNIVFSQKGRDTFVFVDGQETGPYKNLKDAEKTVKDLAKVFKEMVDDGIDPMEALTT